MTYEALGFNPAPGDPGEGAAMVATLRRTTEALGEVETALAGDGDQRWVGRAAQSFRELMADDLRPRITEAHQSFSAATRALDGWVGALPGFQSRADSLEQRARAAVDAVSIAQANISASSSVPADETEAEREDREDRLQGHRAALSGAQSELAGIRAEAEALKEEVDASAATAAGALDTAMQAAPNEPGFWDRVGDVVGGIGDFFADVGDFLADVAEYIKDNWWNLLHQIVKITATVLSIAAIFCPALAPFALGFAIASVAMSGIDWARGVPGAKEEFILGAVGLVGGFAAGKLISEVTKMAGPALANGPFRLVAQGAGGAPAAVPAAAALTYNPRFGPALAGWMVARTNDAKTVSDGVETLLTGRGYYSDDLAAGWREARED